MGNSNSNSEVRPKASFSPGVPNQPVRRCVQPRKEDNWIDISNEMGNLRLNERNSSPKVQPKIQNNPGQVRPPVSSPYPPVPPRKLPTLEQQPPGRQGDPLKPQELWQRTAPKPVDTSSSKLEKPVDTSSSKPEKPVDTSSSKPEKPVDTSSTKPEKPVDTSSTKPEKPVDTSSSKPEKPVDTSRPVPPRARPQQTYPKQSQHHQFGSKQGPPKNWGNVTPTSNYNQSSMPSAPPPQMHFNTLGPQVYHGQPFYQAPPMSPPNMPYFHPQQGPPMGMPPPFVMQQQPHPSQFMTHQPQPLMQQQPAPLMMQQQGNPTFLQQSSDAVPKSVGVVQTRNPGRSEYRPYNTRRRQFNRNGNQKPNNGQPGQWQNKRPNNNNADNGSKTKSDENKKNSEEEQVNEKEQREETVPPSNEKPVKGPKQRGRKNNRATSQNASIDSKNFNNEDSKGMNSVKDQRPALSRKNKGPNDILMKFIGEDIPGLPEALCESIDIGTAVEGVILISDVQSKQPDAEPAKTLLHIVEYKMKHPNAKSILV